MLTNESTKSVNHRLVSRAQFARLAGVSKPRVTKLTQGRLAPAVTGNRVDLDHPLVREYLESEPSAPTANRPPLTSREFDQVAEVVFQRVLARLVRALRDGP